MALDADAAKDRRAGHRQPRFVGPGEKNDSWTK
jgi:hypothetical protein